jgi:DNA-binding GntR family transcriptional regulator
LGYNIATCNLSLKVEELDLLPAMSETDFSGRNVVEDSSPLRSGSRKPLHGGRDNPRKFCKFKFMNTQKPMSNETSLMVQNDEDGATNERAGTIVRRHLHDELLTRLRELITDGELPPGAKVPERELCERFGVSRTPLREALKVLAFEGLVTLNPNRGAAVSPLTLTDLVETFPVIGAIEALAGELATVRITPAELSAIRRLHNKMLQAYKHKDAPSYFAANQAIHEAILSAANNETLSNLYTSLSGRVNRARYTVKVSDARWSQATTEHIRILEALEARDGEMLGRLLKEHLANRLADLKKTLGEKLS